MNYNYSYNVLINRLEAFAAGHLLIKRFTHGQIDLADMDQDEQYPFMHVVPNNIRPVDGGMQFDFQIIFADIPRDKELKAEYQREVISDCVRLAQDLIAEVKNGLVLFGFDVQLVTPPTIEPFMEEYKNTLTGVTFSLQLEVPWDWSACDIPAVWSVGGTSTGGSGTGIGLTLRTNGVDNAVQNILDLVEGTNVTITDNGDGSVTIDAAGGGGGGGEYVSTEYNVNHTTAQGNPYVIGDRVWYNGSVYRCIANNDAINPSNPTYWTLQSVGYRLRQTPVDWNASSGDYQILNKPTLAAVATSGDYVDLSNTPFIPETLKDLQDVSATAPTNGQVLAFNSTSGEWEPATNGSGTVTSVGLSMPNAFGVTGSPVTSAGTLTVSALGTASQYITGDGELANFPALSGFVPYVGATQDVDLDTFKLSASSVYIEGTAGNGHLHLKHQSADATATGQSTALWADTNGDIKWKNDNNYKTTLSTSSNTADRVYTFPNETAELMPRNAAITGATKTKITYDSDGLVTAGADLAAGDIPSGIDAAKIGSGAVSNTEFGYLDGVTSAIQTQLDNKKDTFTLRFGVGPVSPADNTTYYMGEGTLTLSTIATLWDNKIAFACKLVGAQIMANNSTATATSEASTLYVRVNNTTDVLLSNAIVFNGAPPTSTSYTVTGLSQTINANDEITVKWVTPTWVTNPTGAQLVVSLYFERT